MRSASPVTSLNWSPVVSSVLSQIGFISPQLPSLGGQLSLGGFLPLGVNQHTLRLRLKA
jgi:hypothetical protein